MSDAADETPEFTAEQVNDAEAQVDAMLDASIGALSIVGGGDISVCRVGDVFTIFAPAPPGDPTSTTSP